MGLIVRRFWARLKQLKTTFEATRGMSQKMLLSKVVERIREKSISDIIGTT